MKRELPDSVLNHLRDLDRSTPPQLGDGLNADPVVNGVQEMYVKSIQSIVALCGKVFALEDQGADTTEALRSLGMEGKKWAVIHLALESAERNARFSKRQRINASHPRKVSADQKARIRRAYNDMVNAGDKYGAIKALQREYDLSRGTIAKILKEAD